MTDEKPAVDGASILKEVPKKTAKETATARDQVKKRRTPREPKGRARATLATPKRRRVRAKARRSRPTSSGVRRRRTVFEGRRSVPAVKVRRRRRTADGDSAFDALFRLAVALGYRLELRAIFAKRRVRRE